ncbi:MAG: hypothetical protein JW717_05065 [Marinilabiliaceae bacterium]|nr:hypothetical protein [Marinilabiliaceae bacterium]
MSKIAPNRLFLMTVCVMFPFVMFAQDKEKHEMKLLARPMPDSVMLRWAPTTYQLWLSGNKHGYYVLRACLMRDGKLLAKPEEVRLTDTPLKPAPLERWEQIAETNGLAGVAAEAIFGDQMDVEAGNPSSLIEIVNKATEQESKLGFALLAADQNAQVAVLSGLMLIDKTAKKGEKYLYKVYPAYIPEGMVVDTGLFFTGVDEYMPLVPPSNVKAQGDDKMVTITWGLSDYTAFYVERALKGSDQFERLNETPLINTTPEGYDELPYNFYLDTLPSNEQVYNYRIIGLSAFGELSPPSTVVSGKGEYVISQAPIVTKVYSPDNQSVLVQWEMIDEKQKAEGYKIYRSEKFAEGYHEIGQSKNKQSSFTDQTPMYIGYYRVQAFNSDGGGPMSIPRMVQLIDSIPPLPPVGMTAMADTSGKVMLRWNRNNESDIYGYRVFRANSKNEEFSQITKAAILDTFMVDSINLQTLTKKVHYQVVAVDKRQNRSAFSTVFTIERPDIVAPAPPVFKKVINSGDGIQLGWFLSPSADVEHQLLYRKKQEEADWQLIADMSKNDTLYVDSLALPQTRYYYLLLAVDKSGNESQPTKPVVGEYQRNDQGSPWITPKVKVNNREGTVELSWDPIVGALRYVVYEKKQETLHVVKGVTDCNCKIVGNSIAKNSIYFIKAVF